MTKNLLILPLLMVCLSGYAQPTDSVTVEGRSGPLPTPTCFNFLTTFKQQ